MEHASGLECKNCKKVIECELFWEHVQANDCIHTDNTLIDKIKEEKIELTKKLKALESTLKCMERKLQDSYKQRDTMQKEIKRLNKELFVAKDRCMDAEKKKNRAEYLLKSEVRVLLEKVADKKESSKGFRSTSTSDLKLKGTNNNLAASKSTFDSSSLGQPLMRNYTTMDNWTNNQTKKKTRKPIEIPKENFHVNSCSPDPIAKSLNYFIQNASVAYTKEPKRYCTEERVSNEEEESLIELGSERKNTEEFTPSSIDEIMSISGLDPRDFPDLYNSK